MIQWSQRLTCVLLLTTCSVLIGCAAHRQFKTDVITTLGEAPYQALIKGTNFVRSVIEFDDQGELWDRRQLDTALKEVDAITTDGKPITLIIYVHGWKHNASTSSANLRSFDTFIKELAPVVNLPNVSANRVVFGVYIGWRGAALRGDTYLENLTVYGRWKAAERVAGISCTEALFSLIGDVRKNDYRRKQPKQPLTEHSRIVVVGHSMGGLIVEKAFCQSLLGQILSNGPREAQAREVKAQLVTRISNLQKESSSLDATNRVCSERLSSLEADLKRIEGELLQLHGQVEKATQDSSEYASATNTLASVEAQLLSLKDVQTNAWLQEVGWTNELFATIQQFTNKLTPLRPETWSPKLRRPFESLSTIVPSLRTNLVVENLTKIAQASTKIAQALGDWTPAIESDVPDQPQKAPVVQDLRTANSKTVELAGRIQQMAPTILDSLTNAHGLRVQKRMIENRLPDLKEKIQASQGLTGHIAQLIVLQRNQLATREQLQSTNRWVVSELKRLAGEIQSDRVRIINLDLEVKPLPADLVLLVNPASSGIIAKKMIAALKQDRTREFIPVLNQTNIVDRQNQLVAPLIISVTSKRDSATHVIFPFAKRLVSQFRYFRGADDTTYIGDVYAEEIKIRQTTAWRQQPHDSLKVFDLSGQRQYIMRTAPHTDNLLSHDITTSRPASILKTNATKADVLLHNLNGDCGDLQFETPSKHYSITPKNWAWNNSSYWVIQAPPELIRSHSEIWTTDFYALVAGLYRVNLLLGRQPAPDSP